MGYGQLAQGHHQLVKLRFPLANQAFEVLKSLLSLCFLLLGGTEFDWLLSCSGFCLLECSGACLPERKLYVKDALRDPVKAAGGLALDTAVAFGLAV